MIGLVLGALAGLFHRFFVSPFVGKQTQRAQSVGTPAAGVMLAFLPFRFAYRYALRRIIPDKKMRDEVGNVIDGAYWATFYAYGVAVVVTILAGIGGKKNE